MTRRLLDAAFAVLLLLTVAIFFLQDSPGLDANSVLGVMALTAAALTAGSVRLAPLPRDAWPYVIYLAALCVSLAFSISARSLLEFGRQLVFLGIVLAAGLAFRRTSRQGWAVFLAVLFTTIVLVIAADYAMQFARERIVLYPPVRQWSGYPELGLVASIAAGLLFGFVVQPGPLSVRVAALVLALFMGLASYLIYSRSAVVTIVAVLGWLLMARLMATLRPVLAAAVLMVLLLVSGLAITASARLGVGLADVPQMAATPADPDAPRTLDGPSVSRPEVEQAVADRLRGWKTAILMLRDHPLFGVGPGMYWDRYPDYWGAEFEDDSRPAAEAQRDRTHAYNLLLHVGAELGLVGLAAYVAIWVSVLFRTWRSFKAGATLALPAHGALIAFLIRSQSEHFLANLDTSFRILLYVGLLLGLAEATTRARFDSAGTRQTSGA